MVIRGVVFDFDGTIADSETPAFEAWRAVYRLQGLELQLDRWQSVIGTRGFDPVDALEAAAGKALSRESLRAEVRSQVAAEVVRQGPRAGIRETLEELAVAGFRLAVASSSELRWVRDLLHELGLDRYFSCLCGGDEVARVKPAPDLYRLAARRLELLPHSCLAVEDSVHGVQSARSAGMLCVAVPNALTASLDLDAADYRLPSFEDLSVSKLLKDLAVEADGAQDAEYVRRSSAVMAS